MLRTGFLAIFLPLVAFGLRRKTDELTQGIDTVDEAAVGVDARPHPAQLYKLAFGPCPRGYAMIKSETLCSAAASKLEKQYNGSGNTMLFPSHCYMSGSAVHYNTNTIGGIVGRARRVCIREEEDRFVRARGVCPGGYGVVKEEERCEAAAKELGLEYGGKPSWPLQPMHCYAGLSKVYYNDNEVGLPWVLGRFSHVCMKRSTP